MSKPVLYDLARKGHNSCWSLNPWKTRMMLNYKGVDYDSVFVEFPDIPSTLEPLGIPKSTEQSYAAHGYTIPAMKFPDGSHVMDSAKIAPLLEAAYPTPPLPLDMEFANQVNQVIYKSLTPVIGELMQRGRDVFISDASMEYFVEARTKTFGMSIDEMARVKGGDAAWEGVREGAEELAKLLKANGGPFFMGKTVSYADFVLASCLHWLKLGGDDLYNRYVSYDQSLDALHKACLPWFARDD